VLSGEPAPVSKEAPLSLPSTSIAVFSALKLAFTASASAVSPLLNVVSSWANPTGLMKMKAASSFFITGSSIKCHVVLVIGVFREYVR